MDADQVRHDAEGGQGDDIDFRMAEEPEEMLEQEGASPLRVGDRAHGLHRRHEEAGAGEMVEQHHDRRDEQGRKRSEEHTSELQSLMRISYAVFCLKKKN